MFKHINQNGQSGQTLMFIIIFATILLTVGLTITELTTTDTRVANLEEEESRARAAAEAGIETAIGQAGSDSVDIGSLLEGSGISGTAVIEEETDYQFTTPLISKDGQYTFYLLGYDTDAEEILTGNFDDDISINRIEPSDSDYCSGTEAFAVELTLIDATPSTGGIVERYIIDECDLIDSDTSQYTFGQSMPFASVSPEPHIVIARVIAPSNSFDGAQIQFENESVNDFPAQGRTVISTASVGETQNENVTKKIKLFQSHPQFPTEFFVTSM